MIELKNNKKDKVKLVITTIKYIFVSQFEFLVQSKKFAYLFGKKSSLEKALE